MLYNTYLITRILMRFLTYFLIKVSRLAGIFTGYRPPVWVWGSVDHGAIYIQPNLNVQSSLQADQLRKTFYGVHMGRKIREVELAKVLPNQTLIEEGYPAILDLHCVDNEREADKSDYLSRMETIGKFAFSKKNLGDYNHLVINSKSV